MPSSPIVEVFAECLLHYMAERQVTQKELAKRSGIGQTTISLYTRPQDRAERASGKAGSPTLANVEALAVALGVEVWELLRPVNQAERDLLRAVSRLANERAAPSDPEKKPKSGRNSAHH